MLCLLKDHLLPPPMLAVVLCSLFVCLCVCLLEESLTNVDEFSDEWDMWLLTADLILVVIRITGLI